MSEYTACITWQRQPDEAFVDNRYHRRHDMAFDGGAVVPGSSAPSSVPLPWSDAPSTGEDGPQDDAAGSTMGAGDPAEVRILPAAE